MANLLEMKQQRAHALNKAESILNVCGEAKREPTASESLDVDTAMAAVKALNPKIAILEGNNSLSKLFRENPGAVFGAGSPTTHGMPQNPALHSTEYAQSLHSFLSTGGKAHGDELTAGADGFGGYYMPGSERYTQQRRANGSLPGMSAATYEGTEGGSGASGGYAISVPTVPQITPLAPPDLGIFNASLVVPTTNDVKIPSQASFGTSTLKSESTGTIATFGGSDPTLGQIALTAYMAGGLRLASFELLQDVPAFQEFIVSDLLNGQRILEGQLLATGTGSGQPQGVFGNTGTGTGSAYELLGTSADSTTLLNSLFDVTGTLLGSYQANASWIMSRATGLAIRRAQMGANLFSPVFTVDADGTERILGRPVFYDLNAPALPTATTAGVVPILFGDFKQGYIIGVRGGAGINVKVLDQPWAAQGSLGLLAYRRLDGRVRRSEAIQQVKISHS